MQDHLDRGDGALVAFGIVGYAVRQPDENHRHELDDEEAVLLGDLAIGNACVDQPHEEIVATVRVFAKLREDLGMPTHVGAYNAQEGCQRGVLLVQRVRRRKHRFEFADESGGAVGGLVELAIDAVLQIVVDGGDDDAKEVRQVPVTPKMGDPYSPSDWYKPKEKAVVLVGQNIAAQDSDMAKGEMTFQIMRQVPYVTVTGKFQPPLSWKPVAATAAHKSGPLTANDLRLVAGISGNYTDIPIHIYPKGEWSKLVPGQYVISYEYRMK